MEPQAKTKADPQQQKMYDIVMLQAREMIFNDVGMKSVVEQIGSAEKGPASGIGYTAAMLMKSVQGGLKEKGKRVPPEVLTGAYAETVADLTEVAVAAKLVPEEQKSVVAKQALAEGGAAFRGAGKPQPAQPHGAAPPAAQPAPPPARQPGLPSVGGLVKQAMGA